MGYLQEVGTWIEERLQHVHDADKSTDEIISVVRDEIKGKILESYRNGLRDAQKSPKPSSSYKPRV